jgi:hypothetical protein
VSHRGSDILQRRSDLFPFNFERCGQIRRRQLVLLIIFEGHECILVGLFGDDANIKLANTITHDIKQFLIFFGALIFFFHDSFEATSELYKKIRTGVVLFIELHKLSDLYGRGK